MNSEPQNKKDLSERDICTKFVDQVYHLPDRILDLLELAAYVFAGDRAAHRGAKDAVEYHAWLRSMHFVVKVRDAGFWNQPSVKETPPPQPAPSPWRLCVPTLPANRRF
jgi:hypothetical protein